MRSIKIFDCELEQLNVYEWYVSILCLHYDYKGIIVDILCHINSYIVSMLSYVGLGKDFLFEIALYVAIHSKSDTCSLKYKLLIKFSIWIRCIF